MAKKSWFKMAMYAICVIIIGAMATACGANGSKDSAASGNNSESDPPTVTMLIERATNFPEDNPVIQEIREQTGVNLQVDSVVSDDYENRLNTMLASGNAPDIFRAPKIQMPELVDNQVIAPLDELLEEHGQNMLENKGEYMYGPGFIEGEVYGLPDGFDGGNALAIRQDWLDNLGLDVPTTLEEYEEVLNAFVNEDPNESGEDDTIGLGLAVEIDQNWEHIFAAYGVPQNRQVLIDDEIIPWMLAPGYLDAIKYLRNLYQQGLIDYEFATIPTTQSFEKLWNGQVGAYQFNSDGTTLNWLSRYVEDPAPEFVYTMIEGPDGQGGHLDPALEDSHLYTVISNQAEHPEAAMKVLDFMVSEEGYNLTWAGIEGVHHGWTDEGEFEWIEPFDDAERLRDEGGYHYSTIMYRIGGLREELFNDVTREAIQLVRDNTIPDAYIYDTPEIEQQMGSVLDDMEKEFRAQAMVAEGDVEEMYNDFKERYLAEGGSEWIEQATEIYFREQEELEQAE